MPKKFLFIDRDGVINRSIGLPGYLSLVEQFEFLPKTFEALGKLREAGYDFYIITNQAGVARGQATLDQIEEIHEHMRNELKRRGIDIKGIYMCPHRDEDNCDCRKPKPGLLLRAMSEHELDPQKVIFVGDRETDMLAARAAGVRGVLIPSEVGLGAALDGLLE